MPAHGGQYSAEEAVMILQDFNTQSGMKQSTCGEAMRLMIKMKMAPCQLDRLYKIRAAAIKGRQIPQGRIITNKCLPSSSFLFFMFLGFGEVRGKNRSTIEKIKHFVDEGTAGGNTIGLDSVRKKRAKPRGYRLQAPQYHVRS